MEAMTTLTLNHKESISHQHRCQNCWLDPSRCICSQLSDLLHDDNENTISAAVSDHNRASNVKLLILMHPKEHLCAGNSAKLLRMVLPTNYYTVEYYIFGKVGDVDRLAHEMNVDLSNTMILWPEKEALSVSQFLEQQQSTPTHTPAEESGRPMVRAVVLDGTYTQARNMFSSLRKHLIDQQPLPVTVQLRPTTNSVFHRAQKNYGQAHQQQQQQRQKSTKEGDTAIATRISTAEACGLLLTELGAPLEIRERITQAVLINNEAVGHGQKQKTNGK